MMCFTICNVTIGPEGNNSVALKGIRKDDGTNVVIVNNQLKYHPNMLLPKTFDGNIFENNGTEVHELHCKATRKINGEYTVCVAQGTVSTELK